MRVMLESLRFTFIFFVCTTILSFAVSMTYEMIGLNTTIYDWTIVMGAFVLMIVLYKLKGWGKVYNKTILWTSVTFITIFTMLIPDRLPVHLHSDKFAYAYGFPFKFLTIYVENGNKFLLPNLMSKGSIDWSLDLDILVNFLVVYFALYFIFKKMIKSR